MKSKKKKTSLIDQNRNRLTDNRVKLVVTSGMVREIRVGIYEVNKFMNLTTMYKMDVRVGL